MHILKNFYICITALFILFFSCVANAGEEDFSAVFPTWEPYGYVEKGKAVGFEIETFAAVMREMGIKVVFLHQPWKRCLHSVKHGFADAVISALKTPEREEYMFYPREPISISKTAFFTTTDRDIEFNGSYEGLKGYTIGVTNGFSYGAAFNSADFLNKDPSTKTEAVITKVLMGRNELGVGNIAVISTIAAKKNALDKIRFLEPLVHSQKLYVGFSRAKGHEQLTDDFSKALSLFRKSAAYRAILKKYGPELGVLP